VLHSALQAAQKALHAGSRDAQSLQSAMRRVLDQEPRGKVDYAEIVDAQTFQPVALVNRSAYALLAVKFGSTRLLDNMFIEVDESGRLKPITHL
jgi:pantoate--beta-alanine ligase